MQQTHWRFGPAAYDEAAQTLIVRGQEVEIERRPLELLGLLLAHAGEVVTKDEILDRVWPDREVSEASLTKCVARLRQALGDGDHAIIKTVHGFGYRLAVPVLAEPILRPAPAAALPALEPGQPVPGRPNFTLVRRLGTGGFGDAWLADHAKAGERRVFKFAASAPGLAALRREITLGRLLREGLGAREDLVRILDWRLDEMPAFIEIAYFPAGSLADWAQAQGGLAQVPMALRLELVAQIADALAAIHGMAVLHKDLKPANVLIRVEDGVPAIVLTDFGSGRALDAARLDALGITRLDPALTGPDTTTGTQLYRAPELLGGGAATVLADIYALGVMLFQMVASDLQRPLSPGWEEAVDDLLLREDIALAAAGDPTRRLADATELARRLRGLHARHEGRARADAEAADIQRARQALALARARRAPMAALFAVLAAALLATGGLYLRAERAQAQAEREAARAVTVTRFLTDDVFSAANPLLAANPNAPIRAVLGGAAADLDRRFLKGDLDRAAIEQAIGGAYAGLTDPVHARPLLEDALGVISARLGPGDPQAQAIRLSLGALADRLQEFSAISAAGQAVLDNHPADAATELGGRFLVLWGGCNVDGNDGECAARLRPFLVEARQRLGATHALTLEVQSDLAFVLSKIEDFASAIPLARETVVLAGQAYGAESLRVEEQLFHLGEVLTAAGQQVEALQVLKDLRRRVVAASGGETELSARAATQLGIAYYRQKQWPEALAAEQVALDSLRVQRGEGDATVREALGNIANIDAAMGRFADAIANGRHVWALQRAATGPDQGDTIWFENNVANFQHLAGDLPGAEASYRDVVARGRRTFAHGEWDLGHFLFHLGEILAQEGKIAEARSVLTDSLARLTAALGPDHARTRKTLAALQALPK